MADRQMKLKEIYEHASGYTVRYGGREKTFLRGDKEYREITDLLAVTFKGGRQMPAYAVAIDEMTQNHVGSALEIHFDGTMHLDSMPFEKLYIRFEKHYYGVNFERYYEGKYQGRCFYLNFDRPCQKITEYIADCVTGIKDA